MVGINPLDAPTIALARQSEMRRETREHRGAEEIVKAIRIWFPRCERNRDTPPRVAFLVFFGTIHMLGTILIIVLILMLLGALPTWPYSAGWGYYPSSTLGLILIILIVLALMGRI